MPSYDDLCGAFDACHSTLFPTSILSVVSPDLLESIMKGFQDDQAGMAIIYDHRDDINAIGQLNDISPSNHQPEAGLFAPGYNPFCKKFRLSDSQRNEMCSEFDCSRARLVLTSQANGECYTCHMGLKEINYPLHLAGKRRGVLFAGQRVIAGDAQQLDVIYENIEKKAPEITSELKELISTKLSRKSDYSSFVERFKMVGQTLDQTIQTIHQAKKGEALKAAINAVHEHLDARCSLDFSRWQDAIKDVVKAISIHMCKSDVWALARKASRYQVIAASIESPDGIYKNVATRLLLDISEEEFVVTRQGEQLHTALEPIVGPGDISVFRVATPPVANVSLSVILVIRGVLSDELKEVVAGCARAMAPSINYATLYMRLDEQKKRYLKEISYTGHHLKTPIQSALFAIRRLIRTNAISSSKHKQIAERASADLLQACADALQLQTAQLDQMVDVNVYELLLEITKGVGASLAQGREISVKLHKDVPISLMVRGSREHLRIAFYALIDNAIKYSFPERRVDIRHSTRTRVNTRQRKPQVVVDILIENYGVGFPEEKKISLFEEGTRAGELEDQKHISGMGLGLSQAKALIEEHDGAIDISSRLASSGWTDTRSHDIAHLTTVYITLPLSENS